MQYSDGLLDAVAILTPTQSRTEIALAALGAGKHVFAEKPLALSLAECDRLIESAVRSTSRVVVGCNLRWHRLVRRAREFLNCGALVRIKAIRSAYTHNRTGETAPDWHRKLELGGGVSFNEGVHHFDLWRYFTRSEVEQIFSYSVPSQYCEDETNVIAARLSDGVLATGVFTFKTGPTSEVKIYGEDGRLSLSLYRFDGLEFLLGSGYPGDLGDRLRKAPGAARDLPEAIPILRRGRDFQATFDALCGHFIDSILHDLPSQCMLEDGKSSLRVAPAAIESARARAPVKVQATAP